MRRSESEALFLNSLGLSLVGARDHAPLSKDALPSRGDADRPEGRRGHRREARQKQTEADLVRARREARQGVEGRQIRRVLRLNTGINICIQKEANFLRKFLVLITLRVTW